MHIFTSPALDPNSGMSMQSWTVDENYASTLGLKILQGRNFLSSVSNRFHGHNN
jgi:hypothetical protein